MYVRMRCGVMAADAWQISAVLNTLSLLSTLAFLFPMIVPFIVSATASVISATELVIRTIYRDAKCLSTYIESVKQSQLVKVASPKAEGKNHASQRGKGEIKADGASGKSEQSVEDADAQKALWPSELVDGMVGVCEAVCWLADGRDAW
jgi:hypothetical protein